MAEKGTLARPYAQAVFDIARQQDELGAWSELLQRAAGVVGDEQVKILLTSPHIAPEQLVALLLEISAQPQDGEADFTIMVQQPPVRNLFRLLAENRRLDVLAEISAGYDGLKAAAENSVDVEVVSATSIDAAQQERIAAALKTRLGRDIRLSFATDEDLLGGAVIRADDLVIDGSVRSRLSKLAGALIN